MFCIRSFCTMTLYVGYPINFETACDLFGLPHDTTHLLKTIQSTGLDLYRIDKGQYILGLEVKEVADLWDNFVSVDDGIIRILEQKKKVVDLLRAAKIDLSDFLLERMESDPVRVHTPPPYLITA